MWIQQRSCTRLSLAIGLALAAGPSPGADAATPAGEAKQAANAAVDAALGGFRAAEKQARRTFDAELSAFEATLVPPAIPLATAPALAAPIEALQRALTAALGAALQEAAAAHAQTLTDFASATGFAEPFPRDLLAGGGGAADRLRDELRAGAARSVAKARKRLDRTLPLLRAAGLRATLRLEPPRPALEQAPNPGGSSASLVPPLTFDVLIGLSQADQTAGGVVFAGGQAQAMFGTVDVLIDGSDFQTDQATPDPVANRWSVIFGELDLVDAGGEVLIAQQPAGTGAAAMAPIGVP
jgi:hypothetical protein